jgi:hypothetical protein
MGWAPEAYAFDRLGNPLSWASEFLDFSVNLLLLNKL